MVTDTSRMAYMEKIANGSLVTESSKILFMLQEVGNSTSAELSAYTGIDRHNVASRLSDLLKTRSVVKGEKVKCSVCSKACYEWRINNDN